MSNRAVGILFVLAAVISEALGQIAFKRAARGASDLRSALSRDRKQMALGIGCFVVEGFLWTLALKFLDLSVAQPLASSELIVVALLSRIWLREQLSPRRWIGIAIILAGTILVGLN